jgi:hypothetical protein
MPATALRRSAPHDIGNPLVDALLEKTLNEKGALRRPSWLSLADCRHRSGHLHAARQSSIKDSRVATTCGGSFFKIGPWRFSYTTFTSYVCNRRVLPIQELSPTPDVRRLIGVRRGRWLLAVLALLAI